MGIWTYVMPETAYARAFRPPGLGNLLRAPTPGPTPGCQLPAKHDLAGEGGRAVS